MENISRCFCLHRMIKDGASPVFYVANESPVPVNAVLKLGDFADRVKVATAAGRIDRALYYDTSFRGLLDFFAAFDALCFNEDTRYFKGADCRFRNANRAYARCLI
jgi:hypothetical protein